MSDRDFGVLIRQSRERLGLTPSRVAELIGRAPGTIRAWEKGTSTPADAGVVSTLAAVLGIDEVSLFEAAGLEPPVSDSAPSVREALSSITPAARRAAAEEEPSTTGSPDPGTVVEPDPAGVDESDQISTFAPDPVPRAERRRSRGTRPTPTPTPDLFAPPAPIPTAPPISAPANVAETAVKEPRHRARSDSAYVLERLRGATLRRPSQPAALTTMAPAQRLPSYLEDPTERWSYRLRAIYTAVGVVALFIALGWAASNLLEALGSVWEELTANL
ncbi:MAG: multiprotein-bridging factor 1 family protein [Acidimicrobiia bacterium]